MRKTSLRSRMTGWGKVAVDENSCRSFHNSLLIAMNRSLVNQFYNAELSMKLLEVTLNYYGMMPFGTFQGRKV